MLKRPQAGPCPIHAGPAYSTAHNRWRLSTLMKRLNFVSMALMSLCVAARAEDWPQWRGPNRDGVWSETGILQTFPTEGLKIRWRAPVGPGWSSPVVARGRVYVTDMRLAKPSNGV